MLDIKQSELAAALGVTERTINKVCNLNIVPLLYQWAIYGIEFKRNKANCND